MSLIRGVNGPVSDCHAWEKKKNSGTINCACPSEQDTLIHSQKIPSGKLKKIGHISNKNCDKYISNYEWVPQGSTEDFEYKDSSCLLKPKTEFSFN